MSSTTTTTMKFDSEGFDLDAAVSNMNLTSSTNTTAGNKEEAEVIYEIGGRAVTTTTTTTIATSLANSGDNTMLQLAESLKEQGNEYYKNHNYISAYEKYAAAIRTIEEERDEEDNDVATVGVNGDSASSTATTTSTTTSKTKVMTGQEILKKKDLWEQEQHLRLRNELRQRDSQKDDHSSSKNPSTTTATESSSSSKSPQQQEPPPPQFVLDPPHPYGTILATYYCNRAAASMQIAASESTTPTTTATSASRIPSSSSSWYDHEDDTTHSIKNVHPKDQEALQDCTIAILLNPNYTKAYIRRATIYEQRYHPHTKNHTELALQDMMMAQRIEPNNRIVATNVRRLQQLEHERMERMKEETMSKLKDLGNSILGNFGLSLDNFKTQQDPNTGSYNISFSQN